MPLNALRAWVSSDERPGKISKKGGAGARTVHVQCSPRPVQCFLTLHRLQSGDPHLTWGTARLLPTHQGGGEGELTLQAENPIQLQGPRGGYLAGC